MRKIIFLIFILSCISIVSYADQFQDLPMPSKGWQLPLVPEESSLRENRSFEKTKPKDLKPFKPERKKRSAYPDL